MVEAATAEKIVEESPQSITPDKVRVWPLAMVAAIQIGVIVFWLMPSMNNLVRFVAMMAGPLACSVAFAAMTVFASRLGFKRGALIVLAIAVMAAIVGLTAAHRSGLLAWILGVPLAMVLTTVGLGLGGRASSNKPVQLAIALSAIGWLTIATARLDGFDGAYMPEMSFRWSPSAEDRLMQELANETPVAADSLGDWTATTAGWSGFRGPNRDSRVVEELPKLNWETQPPKEIWRRPVGPAWSSMAVIADRVFTQEQRGEQEAITCYDAKTGDLIWSHEEASRFEEVVSGAGPRATPTVSGDRVFAAGARGIVVALSAKDGSLLWRRDFMEEYGVSAPMWGFSASPLVVDGLVIAFAGASGDNGLIALDADSGENVWSVPTPNSNYGSAQLVTLGGEKQIVFVEPGFVRGLTIQTGEELWRSDVIEPRDFPMVQPQQISDSALIVTTGDGKRSVRIDITKDNSWKATKVWDSRYLKPSYNDFIFYKGALYGFDKQIFACINAEDGKRHWKNGRYGFGQAILLEAAGQIVVVAESGELILLDANTKGLKEVGRVDAMSSKTWNHPAVDSGVLFVRNAEEMVAYRLR